MREIPFDPNDPQAALGAAPSAEPQAGGWHSVAPPGFVAPPAAPPSTSASASLAPGYLDAGGGSRAAWNGSAIVADPSTTHHAAEDIAAVLMQQARGPRYRYFGVGWGSWSVFSFIGSVVSSLFGGSGWMRS